ncbi:electrogenic sodium bicarbonate cotransporter 1-like isoform X2 [Liolophura sinensis]|uniref:electrogenic sodium bicarbonate cotransporter 1-like isoform X2 n=1 Tax=Liolophura sinensis TaxID=3198878 RepID=UPI003158EC3D
MANNDQHMHGPRGLPPKRNQRHGSLAEINYSPSVYISSLLGDGEEDHSDENKHNIFCEMDILFKHGEDYEWKESARWVKYEEDVEEGGNRWSKPHVASLSMYALFELRNAISNGCVMLDVHATTIAQLVEAIVDRLISEGRMQRDLRNEVKELLLKRHWHQHHRRPTERSHAARKRWESARLRMRTANTFADLSSMNKDNIAGANGLRGRDNQKRRFSDILINLKPDKSQKRRFSLAVDSTPDMTSSQSTLNMRPSTSDLSLSSMDGSVDNLPYTSKPNKDFLRKIPKGSEVANILVGEVESLRQKIVVFARLDEAKVLGDITEVNLPTKFMFVILGPKGFQSKYTEMGRAMATMAVDEIFREVAYKARERQDILAAMDEFMEQVTVLPPGEWDPAIRLEPPDKVPPQFPRRLSSAAQLSELTEIKEIQEKEQLSEASEEAEEEAHFDPTLVRSGRLFGGMINDIKRKAPWYLSDYKDSLHVQCFASFIYLYLATLTPNVTFGGVLGTETNNYMAAMECILAAAITGIIFALFSGQPLNILGSTGPMLVLEMIVYNFCKDNDLDYMPYRVWIGLWTALILLVVVALDLSALVRYITRFTEECFATLIAVIFIYEAFHKLFDIAEHHEGKFLTHPDENRHCFCSLACDDYLYFNSSDVGNMTSAIGSTGGVAMTANMSMENMTAIQNCFDETTVLINETLIGGNFTKRDCLMVVGADIECPYVPDVFLMSLILYAGTFVLTIFLVNFKRMPYFSAMVRQFISDFGVLIAILSMVLLDWGVGLPTPKLTVPSTFEPTNSKVRGWFINPISDKNPWWLPITGVIPGLLASILIFMDQQITAVIVNRKENKLKKGSGYHLDMFVVALLIAACSLLGLPWYVAATVSAIAHIMSLKKESECNAPGEKPVFLGVREQRVTALLVGILSGLTVFMTVILKFIPMAVLYGVFFYMGVAALTGMQFIDRILIMFMPKKYQPDYMYLRHVRLWRVHLFTAMQIACLAVLMVIKQIKLISIVFPIMVLGTCFVRKFMDCIFTQTELKWLDDIMPGSGKKKVEKVDPEKIQADSVPSFKTVSTTDLEMTKSNGKAPSFYIQEEQEPEEPEVDSGRESPENGTPPPSYDNSVAKKTEDSRL